MGLQFPPSLLIDSETVSVEPFRFLRQQGDAPEDADRTGLLDQHVGGDRVIAPVGGTEKRLRFRVVCPVDARPRRQLPQTPPLAIGAVGDFKRSAHRGEIFCRRGGSIALEIVAIRQGKRLFRRNRRFAFMLTGCGRERIDRIGIERYREAVAASLDVVKSNELLLGIRSPHMEVGRRQSLLKLGR